MMLLLSHHEPSLLRTAEVPALPPRPPPADGAPAAPGARAAAASAGAPAAAALVLPPEPIAVGEFAPAKIDTTDEALVEWGGLVLDSVPTAARTLVLDKRDRCVSSILHGPVR